MKVLVHSGRYLPVKLYIIQQFGSSSTSVLWSRSVLPGYRIGGGANFVLAEVVLISAMQYSFRTEDSIGFLTLELVVPGSRNLNSQ